MAYHTKLPIVTDGLVFSIDPYNTKSYVSGDTTTYNLKNGGNNGTLINGVTYDNNAFEFDGASQRITFGSLGSFPSEGTLTFWLNPNSVTNYQNPLSTWSINGLNRGIRFEFSSAPDFGWLIGTDGGVYDADYLSDGTPDPNMVSGVWYEVSLSWNVSLNRVSSTLNNIQRQFNKPHTNWPTIMPDFVLGNGFTTSRYFDGFISHVMLYNRELTYDEMTQNYNALKGRFV